MDAYATMSTMSTQVFSAFAHFEERHREYERARVIYKVRSILPFFRASFISFDGGGGLLADP